ncbi:hypothetical protein DSO57_1017946 [Entomophthora muscae]|uniref:Uncharacterized protein n=1 Tax=Entomophthora muscae TaxID=34485 RepID=A0ACC2TSG9_9FUNG|nr:hypothetical protein DSO57_1017946 [Entomophthora muscae]
MGSLKCPPDDISKEKIKSLDARLKLTDDEKARQTILREKTILSYPMFWKSKPASLKNFETLRKQKPQHERPKLIRDWTSKGRDMPLPLKDLLELMNSKLVGSTQRATTWRILNRAYHTDETGGSNYPYKGLNMRPPHSGCHPPILHMPYIKKDLVRDIQTSGN